MMVDVYLNILLVSLDWKAIKVIFMWIDAGLYYTNTIQISFN